MPVPAGNNDMTLGRPIIDVASLQTLQDVIDAIAKLQSTLIGEGYPSPAKSGDTVYQSVYYAAGNFYGGKPSDPTNPDLLLSAAGGTVIVQDEGTPLASPTGTLNFIGAGVTAVLNGAVADITIGGGGGSSNSFETINTDVTGPIVADSATDTATFVGGNGITTTGTAGSDTITWDADIDEDKGLEFVSAKIAVNIDDTKGLDFDISGQIYVAIDEMSGLHFVTGVLAVNIEETKGLSFDGDGDLVVTESKGIFFNSGKVAVDIEDDKGLEFDFDTDAGKLRCKAGLYIDVDSNGINVDLTEVLDYEAAEYQVLVNDNSTIKWVTVAECP
jgi:hypothetical protein